MFAPLFLVMASLPSYRPESLYGRGDRFHCLHWTNLPDSQRFGGQTPSRSLVRGSFTACCRRIKPRHVNSGTIQPERPIDREPDGPVHGQRPFAHEAHASSVRFRALFVSKSKLVRANKGITTLERRKPYSMELRV